MSDKLTEFSNSKGISKNAVIIMAIDEFLKKHEEISKHNDRGDQDE